MNRRENAFVGNNLGWRLETLVYLELLRRKSATTDDIYYFKTQSAEADFVVCGGNTAKAIYQVSYDISSSKTRAREIRGCIAAAEATACPDLYLITNNEEDTINIDKPKSVIKISLPFNLYLRPYCDRFAEGIAGYVEVEREARRWRERLNG